MTDDCFAPKERRRFRDVFGARQHVVLPVIHVETCDQAARNADIARTAGGDGVFLINHGISHQDLLEIARKVRREFAGFWIGVNCLDLAPEEVFRVVDASIGGIWVDNASIDERQISQSEAEHIQQARQACGWTGLYFGGVAFKYQRPVADLARAAALATRYMDVVTTSGPGTGKSAPVEKIVAMKQAMGDFPLAIASGITPENVESYLPVADCFLVATGIGRTWSELDPARVQDLIQAVRSDRTVRNPVPRVVCFVCEWNEGRSAHLEMSVRRKLKDRGIAVEVISAGLRPGGSVQPRRRQFLLSIGVPEAEIERHVSTVFCREHLRSDLVLVAELPMKDYLLRHWPELAGRVMTVRGFLRGFRAETEHISHEEAHIEDTGDHPEHEKLVLYRELETIAAQVADRLCEMQR